jgi:hypothetical protein
MVHGQIPGHDRIAAAPVLNNPLRATVASPNFYHSVLLKGCVSNKAARTNSLVRQLKLMIVATLPLLRLIRET